MVMWLWVAYCCHVLFVSWLLEPCVSRPLPYTSSGRTMTTSTLANETYSVGHFSFSYTNCHLHNVKCYVLNPLGLPCYQLFSHTDTILCLWHLVHKKFATTGSMNKTPEDRRMPLTTWAKTMVKKLK